MSVATVVGIESGTLNNQSQSPDGGSSANSRNVVFLVYIRRRSSKGLDTQSVYLMFSNFSCCPVPYNNRYTLLLGNISLYFVLQQLFFRLFFISSFFYP